MWYVVLAGLIDVCADWPAKWRVHMGNNQYTLVVLMSVCWPVLPVVSYVVSHSSLADGYLERMIRGRQFCEVGVRVRYMCARAGY